jgi:Tfp pilus assembly protein PilF
MGMPVGLRSIGLRGVVRIFAAAAVCLVSCRAAVPTERAYELRGRVLQKDGAPFTGAVFAVIISGATRPFTARTQTDLGGRFKFADLEPATYNLTIVGPSGGDMTKTVEIGPSGAVEGFRVEETFCFDAGLYTETPHTVSARRLAVPEKARREFERALTRLSEHRVAEAAEILQKVVESAPGFADAWNQLGIIAYQTGDYPSAERQFREALKQEPDSFSALVNLGGVLVAQGKSEEGLAVNRRAMEKAPHDALAQSQLGLAYFLLDRLAQAEEHLRQAKTLDPRHFSSPQLVLAEIYRLQGKFAESRLELEEFLRLRPDSAAAERVRQLLGRAPGADKSP